MSNALDTTAYYHAAYELHAIMNPLRVETLRSIAEVCLPRRACKVLDIGSGKGHASLLLAREFRASCTLVDVSEQWSAAARSLFEEQGLSRRASIITADAAAFRPKAAFFDMILCLGTAPIYGSFGDAIDALLPALAADGHLVIGEPTIDGEIPRKYKRHIDAQGWDILTTADILALLRARGLEIVYSRRSTTDEWDEYMSLQWSAIAAHADRIASSDEARNFLAWMRLEQDMYLPYQRRLMDWTVFVVRRTR